MENSKLPERETANYPNVIVLSERLWYTNRMISYKKRILDGLLPEKLESAGAVVLEGAKWCGKTTTAEQIAQSVVYMSDPSKVEQNILYSRIQPKKILDGAAPRGA